MRFPKGTRAAIQEGAPNPVTIQWPSDARQPQPHKLYWLQKSNEEIAEEQKRALAKRQAEPETHREVMAEMHRRKHGSYPSGYKFPDIEDVGRPKKGDDRVIVLKAEIQEKGWTATVALYEDPDPIRHLGVKTKVPAGDSPFDGSYELAEYEPEQIVAPKSRREREEEEEVLRIEHKASVDHSEIMKAEQRLLDQRRKGKPGKLAAVAIERAHRRAKLVSADRAA